MLCVMKLKSGILLSLAILPLLTLSCQMERAKLDPSGYWADSSGMAMFQIKPEAGDMYSISSSLGSLKGKQVESTIKGTTDLNDSFFIECKGDSLIYSILGVSIVYYRVPASTYDSLARVLAQ